MVDVFVHRFNGWNATSAKKIFINKIQRGELSKIANKITRVSRVFNYLFMKSMAKWHRILSRVTPFFSSVEWPYILQMFCYHIEDMSTTA